ncbi:MAG: DUF2029 domain-containing protein [marine benthic group bacterium]|nr:DUF2029 domain-containing protein [Candidatus Benthicola marisminoris]
MRNELEARFPVVAGLRLSTPEVVVAITLLALSAYLLLAGLADSWATGSGLMNESGLAVGRDFTMFWSASVLALEGNAGSVYDFQVIRDLQGLLTGVPDPAYPGWLYPPTALLLVAPVSLLPYKGALIAWSVAGTGALGFVLWKLSRDPALVPALLLFPAVALCLINGQSGLFLAALVGGGLVLVDRRPWVAGVLLGIATVKPQMLLLVVPCLLLGRHWKTILALVVTFDVLVALSLLAFGTEVWSGFFGQVLGGVDILENVRPLERMPSVLVAASLAGLGRGAAMAAQILVGILVLVAVGWTWVRRLRMPVRGSALLFGLPLVTPYSFDYDLAVLTVAIAWLLMEAGRRGWLRGEKALIAILWISPIAGWLLAAGTGLLLTPLVLAAALAGVLRAAHLEGTASPLEGTAA